jgi:glycosyltransferase 2 family protein
VFVRTSSRTVSVQLETLHKSLRHLASLALLGSVVLALLLAFRGVEPMQVIDLIRGAGVPALLVLLPQAASMTLEAWAWQRSIHSVGYHPEFLPLFRIRVATEAMYLLLPGGVVLAESLKPVMLERRARLPLEVGVGATFFRKYLRLAGQGPYVLAAALFGGSALLALSHVWLGNSLLYRATWGFGLFVSAAALALAVSMRRARIAELLFSWLSRWPSAWTKSALTKVRHRFEQVDTVARDFFRLPIRETILPIALSGFCWLFEAVESWIALRLVGVDLPFGFVLGVDVAISLLRQLAFFLPGGIGLQEAGYVGALLALGVPAPLESAAAFSLLKRAKDMVWGGFGLALVPALLLGTGKQLEPNQVHLRRARDLKCSSAGLEALTRSELPSPGPLR